MITRIKYWLLRRQNERLRRELIRARSYHTELVHKIWTRTGRIKG